MAPTTSQPLTVVIKLGALASSCQLQHPLIVLLQAPPPFCTLSLPTFLKSRPCPRSSRLASRFVLSATAW